MIANLNRFVVAAVALLFATSAFAQSTEFYAERNRRIAIWGSSVANGVGDESLQGGYAGHLEELLESRGWEVFNRSRDGDNTLTITPRFEPGATPEADTEYLTEVDPAYVVIGLSLGNEGIAQCQLGQTRRCTSTLDEADAIFEQFAGGLQRLIWRAREAGIVPIVTLPYARSDFFEREYSYTRRMNLLINSWDVPSVNLLGTIDDGQGRWGRGLWSDPFHPNAAGHNEMFHAFVPSLFAALEAGKPVPNKSSASGFARVKRNSTAPMLFDVNDTMRSFALTFMVRPAADGVIAAISGQTLDHDISIFRRSYGKFEWDTESLELRPSNERFVALLRIDDERVTYHAESGNTVSSPVGGVTHGWHYVTLSHYAARGETLLYVDGQLAGIVAERLQPSRFVLGGPGIKSTGARSARADYKDWMIHRAGLNGDEVAALHNGALLQASLEIYMPLVAKNRSGSENWAQSLSQIRVDPAAVKFYTATE
ncbi:MAG: SGNH/GDSL hydrolase family protein [Gammaproteobacteria bacterium]|nr:SGNH/GDSL hydrolase family protein [Gammaproteobacteria bacterium]